MGYMYFDESIREHGQFIVGALVLSKRNLSADIRNQWRQMGLEPEEAEYKSSDPKQGNETGQAQRRVSRSLLHRAKLGLLICPASDRTNLGKHAYSLTRQLSDRGFLEQGNHSLFIDQGIRVPNELKVDLSACGITTHTNQNSIKVAGLQVADHAAHALGGMLLEEMGLINKSVKAGPKSGYDPDLKINLGFELWASVRYALIGKNEEIPGLSKPGDEANPYFRVEGNGLYIAPSCNDDLADAARQRFGVNYLGCIH
jgi:hypothetical protein